MNYRSVGNRIAVGFDSLGLPVPRQKALAILGAKGFSVVDVDVVVLARERVGVSRFKRGALSSEAPALVDCSGLMKWLYGQRGIWLPRRSIQQYRLGEKIELENLSAGDAIFTTGRINYYMSDPADRVGHVALYVGDGKVIHAANSKRDLVECSLYEFLEKKEFRGARRYVPDSSDVVTLEIPSGFEVEFDDDIRWVVLQTLPV